MNDDTGLGQAVADRPLQAQAIAFQDAPTGPAGPSLQPAGNPLHAVSIRLQACVGEVAMTVGQLLDAREHAVLAVDRTVDAPIDLLLNGRVVARGQLVAVEDRFAVRITDLPLPLGV